jgi:CubicO group peptidase (beta-lactamase class C family)
MAAIVELLLGLLVEVFREFQQWWLGRARLRAATPAVEPDDASPLTPPEVEPLVAELLVRHARRHVGVAVGVIRGERTWFMGSGTSGPGGASPPAADTIFEIGSVTKVFTATLLAAMVDEGLLELGDPVPEHLPAVSSCPYGAGRSRSPISPATPPACPACRAASSRARSAIAATRTRG